MVFHADPILRTSDTCFIVNSPRAVARPSNLDSDSEVPVWIKTGHRDGRWVFRSPEWESDLGA